MEENSIKIEIRKDKHENLTSKKRLALYELKNDKNIAIKVTDKRSALVVWNREHYIKETKNK